MILWCGHFVPIVVQIGRMRSDTCQRLRGRLMKTLEKGGTRPPTISFFNLESDGLLDTISFYCVYLLSKGG